MVVGIICEYNPFHNGHAYHIAQAKKELGASAVVCVMSGNFVQRGECAAFDKWQRAKWALMGGADLVLELPTGYCLQSAQGFAHGAVATLNALGIVDVLSFGSEAGELLPLQKAAKALGAQSAAFNASLKRSLKRGLSYPAAHSNAAKEAHGLPKCGILDTPNNLLAVEYIKALEALQSPIAPHTIARKCAGHDEMAPSESFASATYLRSLLKDGKDISGYVPAFVAKDLVQPVAAEGLYPLLAYALLCATPDGLKDICGTGDGLGNRLLKASLQNFTGIDTYLSYIKTKRYTMSRIKRTLLNILLKNNTKSNQMPEYIRVLALNSKGTKLLKAAKKTCQLPIITKTASFKNLQSPLLALDIFATDVYSILQRTPENPAGMPAGRDFTVSPVFLPNPNTL